MRVTAVAFFLLLGLQSTPTAGQEAPTCTYDECALRLREHGLFGPEVLRGRSSEVIASVGAFGRSLMNIVQASDSAAYHAHIYDRNKNRAFIASAAGSLLLAASVVSLTSDEGGLALGFALSGLAFSTAGDRWRRSAQEGMSRALWWYNRDLQR